jgi:hypothetical protein
MFMDNSDWQHLLRAIKDWRCSPFLGAGISYPFLPLGREIAEKWATDYGYPMSDADDLIKVSQYLAVTQYPMFPKDDIASVLREKTANPASAGSHPAHQILARLPITTYLTTNYDNFMAEALIEQYRAPKVELCRWNSQVKDRQSQFDTGYQPDPSNPVVFHLHGHLTDPYSMVLTEDDYFDFLVNVAADSKIVPQPIQQAITQSSLLFIGYRLADWNFRVLLRSLTRFMEQGTKRRHFAVMRPPAATEGNEQKALDYWTAYYDKLDIQVCWTTANEFLSELATRWEAAKAGGRA